MAGLAGIVDTSLDPQALQKLLDDMLHSLQAESWHKPSGQVLAPAALGRVSLEIFNPGPQPISDQDNGLFAIMEGEIFNPLYQPLKQDLLARGHPVQSDNHAELLLYLYKEYGEDFVRGLNGSFNLVIWDQREQKLLIVNDHYGSRPFFYHDLQPGLLFASDIKALVQDSRVSREVNEEAIIEFFTLRFMFDQKTPLVGVRLMPPATILTYHNGHVTQRSYWTPDFDAQRNRRPFQEYVDQSTHLLRQAVNRCMSQGQTTGFLLSGGIDSRLLVGLVDRRHKPFHTFTRGTPGCDDARLAQIIADKVGSTHHFMEIPPDYLIHRAKRGVWLTDGLMTAADFYELSTLEHVAEHVEAACFGLVPEGMMGLGLKPDRWDLTDQQLADEIYAARAVLIQDWMQPLLFTDDFYQRIRGVVRRNLLHTLRAIPLDESQLKIQYYYMRHYGSRTQMHGPKLTRSKIETRLPFADIELLDYVYTIPADLLTARKLQIEVLKQGCPELAYIPWQYSGLPAAASTPKRTRLKRALYRARRELHQRTFGLVPLPKGREQADYPTWFRTVLRPWLQEILLSGRTLARGYYRREGIERLIQEHMSKRHDRTLQFGLLLTFELWNRIFIDGEYVQPLQTR